MTTAPAGTPPHPPAVDDPRIPPGASRPARPTAFALGTCLLSAPAARPGLRPRGRHARAAQALPLPPQGPGALRTVRPAGAAGAAGRLVRQAAEETRGPAPCGPPDREPPTWREKTARDGAVPPESRARSGPRTAPASRPPGRPGPSGPPRRRPSSGPPSRGARHAPPNRPDTAASRPPRGAAAGRVPAQRGREHLPHHWFAQHLLMVLSGQRPVHSLLGHVHGGAYDELVRLARLAPLRPRGADRTAPVLVAVGGRQPREGVIEAFARIASGGRRRAMAFRLELCTDAPARGSGVPGPDGVRGAGRGAVAAAGPGARPRWRCAAVELDGLPPDERAGGRP